MIKLNVSRKGNKEEGENDINLSLGFNDEQFMVHFDDEKNNFDLGGDFKDIVELPERLKILGGETKSEKIKKKDIIMIDSDNTDVIIEKPKKKKK